MLAELQGISIDRKLLLESWKNTADSLADLEAQINLQWQPYFKRYEDLQRYALQEKHNAALALNKYTEKQAARAEKSLVKALESVKPFNLNSSTQLKWLLNECLGLDARNLKDEESTDKETLTRLALQNEEVKLLLAFRKANKLVTSFYPTYNDIVSKADKIHPSFNVVGTRTGRLSCNNPNLQQVPKELHALFTAKPGHLLITKDLSAIEPTVLAYYSEDLVLCNLMINKKDFHGTTAVAAFDLPCDPSEVKAKFPQFRNTAKTVGLAVLYGAGARQVHLTLQKDGYTDFTLSDAKRIVDNIRALYKGVWEFKKYLDKELERGQLIYNLFERPLKIQNKDDVYMTGLNTLVQSTASDLLVNACHIISEQKAGIKPLLLVHDELVCEVREEEAELAAEKIVEIMCNQVKLTTEHGIIPIRTEGQINKRWEK
jgi:DNA polymerase I